MAQLWSTGPASIYVSVLQAKAPGLKPNTLRQADKLMGNMGGGIKGQIPQRAQIVVAALANPLILPGFLAPGGGPNAGPVAATYQKNAIVPGPKVASLNIPDKPPAPRLRVPAFLGHAEHKPIITIMDAGDPWFADDGGDVYPVDEAYVGQEAEIVVALSRFNNAVLDRVNTKPNPYGGLAGRNRIEDFGAMQGLEFGTYQLYVDFPYSQFETEQGLQDGYRFWSCRLVSAEIVPGSSAQTAICHFKAKMALHKTLHNSPESHAAVERGARFATLYDYDVSVARKIGPN